MKINLYNNCYITIIFIIFLSVLFSACGGSSSENSGDKPVGNVPPTPEVETIKSEDVATALEEAQTNISQGATITLSCKCGKSFIRGQGADEDTAKTKAQEKCTKVSSIIASEEPLSISECKSVTATPST